LKAAFLIPALRQPWAAYFHSGTMSAPPAPERVVWRQFDGSAVRL